ncbi:hypothetical protein CQW23_28074 [Capsicum baccatum]|uniref:Uncharacterized protein n=1 Tax=Capsicum baccatum TaxID=33114 RepID=A0A2G2VFK6_CAPBA|nr:hypothetical protein CQW23_28074 [Capsicum baccatum]
MSSSSMWNSSDQLEHAPFKKTGVESALKHHSDIKKSKSKFQDQDSTSTLPTSQSNHVDATMGKSKIVLQNLTAHPNSKTVDGIRMEFFEVTTITRKIILEGGLVAINDGSRSRSGSGVEVRANDAPLTVFETISHYDYDHTCCTDFTTCSKCSSCKCQDYKAKHDRVINSINSLTASIKEMTCKRGVSLSKRISYPYTPLEIKEAKRRRKDTSKD